MWKGGQIPANNAQEAGCKHVCVIETASSSIECSTVAKSSNSNCAGMSTAIAGRERDTAHCESGEEGSSKRGLHSYARVLVPSRVLAIASKVFAACKYSVSSQGLIPWHMSKVARAVADKQPKPGRGLCVYFLMRALDPETLPGRASLLSTLRVNAQPKGCRNRKALSADLRPFDSGIYAGGMCYGGGAPGTCTEEGPYCVSLVLPAQWIRTWTAEKIQAMCCGEAERQSGGRSGLRLVGMLPSAPVQ